MFDEGESLPSSLRLIPCDWRGPWDGGRGVAGGLDRTSIDPSPQHHAKDHDLPASIVGAGIALISRVCHSAPVISLGLLKWLFLIRNATSSSKRYPRVL